MKHTVIIPAYKADWCIKDVIASIDKQTIQVDEVLIGIDCCTKTKKTLLNHKYKKVKVYWFSKNVGPYLIRNTLACLAKGEILHFFDADDLMKPNHIKEMSKIEQGYWNGCNAEYEPLQDSKPPAHGIMSIFKNDFINNQGFEDWLCGADTEAIYRWQYQGMIRKVPNKVTAIIRQHKKQLTKTKNSTSEERQTAKQIIQQRLISPKTLNSIKTAECELLNKSSKKKKVELQKTPVINKHLTIVNVSDHCCIRVIKQSLALMSAGHQVINLCRRIANPDMASVLSYVTYYNDKEDLKRKLLGLRNTADIFHVHNEPSWLGYFTKNTLFDKPVVFDAHDLNCVRYNKPDEQEYNSIITCDATIYVSQACEDLSQRHYNSDKPSAVIMSACNIGVKYIPPKQRRIGVVYQGGISDGSDLEYLDYRDITNQMSQLNIPFHIYAASTNYMHLYQDAIIHPPQQYENLIAELSRYDWGLCAGGKESRQWHNTLPNKLFEYIAAGIPIVAMKATETANFVKQHNIGIVINNLYEMIGLYDTYQKYKENVIKARELITMEAQVKTIETLYRSIL